MHTTHKMKPSSSQIIQEAFKSHKLKIVPLITLAREYACEISTAIFNEKDREKIRNGQIITRNSYEKFRKGNGEIRQDICKAFCHVLHLDESQILMLPDSMVKNGQREIPYSHSIFNDYEGHRCLDEMWVDPLPTELGHGGVEYGSMNFRVMKAESVLQDKYVSLIFKRQGWGCNVTLRPSRESSIITDKFNFVTFELRTPERNPHIYIGVRIRITDAQNTIWCYGRQNKQKTIAGNKNNHVELGICHREGLSVISNNKWKRIRVSLQKENWFNFIHDGEAPRQEFPDFSKIKLITFDVGFENSSENDQKCLFSGFSRQDTKEGELHISKITFF
jgi:hypothetical protein